MTSLQHNQSATQEPFGQQLLSSLLSSDGLNDVTLKCNDEMEVSANRFILAAKSPVFQSFLLGKFIESNSKVVVIDFPGSVVEKLVEYVYTDSIEGVLRNRKSIKTKEDASDLMSCCMSLLAISDYFDLPRLSKKTQECLPCILDEHPSLAFGLLEFCRSVVPSLPQSVSDQALAQIRSIYKHSFEGTDVAMLSPSVLKEVLKDKSLKMKRFDRFLLVDQWANNPGEGENRNSKARQYMKCIGLDKIHPDYLTNFVQPSGFIIEEDYKKILAAAKKTFGSCPLDVETVEVVGAGTRAVNGVYTRKGSFNGANKYVMHGTYSEEDSPFQLLLCTVSNNTQHWYICVVPGSTAPGTSADIDFYSAPVLSNGSEFPPEGGWTKSKNGVGPPPVVRYIEAYTP